MTLLPRDEIFSAGALARRGTVCKNDTAPDKGAWTIC